MLQFRSLGKNNFGINFHPTFVWFLFPPQGSACRFENHAYFMGRKSYSNTNKRSYVSKKETTKHVKNNVVKSNDHFHFKKQALVFFPS